MFMLQFNVYISQFTFIASDSFTLCLCNNLSHFSVVFYTSDKLSHAHISGKVIQICCLDKLNTAGDK